MPDGGGGANFNNSAKTNSIAVIIFRDNCKPLRVTPHHVWGQSLRLRGVKASASASTSPRSLEPREADNGGGSVTIHVSVAPHLLQRILVLLLLRESLQLHKNKLLVGGIAKELRVC